IEVKSSDEETTALLSPLDDPITRAATSAERAVSRGLGGSCQVPLAAYAEVRRDRLWLRALVGNAKTGSYVEAEAEGPIANPENLASRVVEQLTELGALRLLAA
ncbi:MAG TPA: hydroxymethylbilane synthase, partial [Burkholderiaceae bacterium]|nr:hydroxymethylbilane synthase [Burkholderiaceae bacterium]